MKIPMFSIAVLLSLVMVINPIMALESNVSMSYCTNNNTLYQQVYYEKVKDGVLTEYSFNDTTYCWNGCSNETLFGFGDADCNPSQIVSTVIMFILTVFILFVVFGLYNFIMRFLS